MRMAGRGLILMTQNTDIRAVAHGVDRSLFFRFFAHFSYISLKSCNSVNRFLSDHPSIFFPVFLRFSVSL
jgi:hypothetical protein